MTDYYPFGEIRSDQTTTAHKNNYKFTGKELDTDTGLYYYGARYYNPSIGRFASRDPWEGDPKDPQSLNKYSYVRNNPLKYVDPTGKFFFLVPTGLFDNKFNFSNVANVDSFSSTNTSQGNTSIHSGTMDESGNLLQPHFNVTSDLKNIIGAGITFALGKGLIGKLLTNGLSNAGSGKMEVLIDGKPQGTKAQTKGTVATRRPEGIPENWIEKPANRNDGIIYQDPNNPHNSVRVMDGNPESPNPAQQKPYVINRSNGKTLNVNGSPVPYKSEKSHIPLDQFKFKP